MRYIWGGEEGRFASGSGRGEEAGASVTIMGVVGGGSMLVPGGGAPLTIWSRFDMMRSSGWFVIGKSFCFRTGL